jgi:AcrR family transcriptional regulator
VAGAVTTGVLADAPEPARRQEFLAVAASVFVEHSFGRTSVSALARAFGVRKATFYHYFSSKEEVLQAVLKSGIINIYEDAREAVGQQRTPLAQLDALLDCHARHVERAGSLVVLYLVERHALSEPFQAEYLALRHRYDDLFVEVIRSGQTAGVFRDGNPRIMANGIIGMYNWLVQWYHPSGRLGIPEIHRHLRELALDGLRTGEPAVRRIPMDDRHQTSALALQASEQSEGRRGPSVARPASNSRRRPQPVKA